MVRGINSFRDWFRGCEEQYAIIGGTACDLLMAGEGLTFRATKDIDLVLIVEAVDAAFRQRFWEYVVAAGYEHKDKSSGEPQFYRFTDPQSHDYPTMIEPLCVRIGVRDCYRGVWQRKIHSHNFTRVQVEQLTLLHACNIMRVR